MITQKSTFALVSMILISVWVLFLLASCGRGTAEEYVLYPTQDSEPSADATFPPLTYAPAQYNPPAIPEPYTTPPYEPAPEIPFNPNFFVNGNAFEFRLISLMYRELINLQDLSYALAGTEKETHDFWDNFNATDFIMMDFTPADFTPAEPLETPPQLEIKIIRTNDTPHEVLSLLYNNKPHFFLTDLAYLFDIQMEQSPESRHVHIATAVRNPAYTLMSTTGKTRLWDPSGYLLDTWRLSMDGLPQMLSVEAVFRNGRMYMSVAEFTLAMGLPMAGEGEMNLFDLTEKYNLLAYFNRESGTLELFTGHQRPGRLPPLEGNTRDAFMRLEDVIAAGVTHHTHTLLKRRAMADLFYRHGAVFTIAWVPVNVRPLENFRNDPREYSRYNLEFIFTMDYKISCGAQMGLHGYTHQMGNTNSIAGHEFGGGVSNDRARELFQNQLDAAAYFGWTAYSFTFPKHRATDRQFEIAGEYFDFIMPNFSERGSNVPRRLEINGREVLYMNAAQDHMIDASDAQLRGLLRRLNRAGDTASFFFHTVLEYHFITITREDGRPIIHHDENSNLHRILDNLRDNERVLQPTTHFFS